MVLLEAFAFPKEPNHEPVIIEDTPNRAKTVVVPSGQALWLQYDGGYAQTTTTAAFVVCALDGVMPITGWRLGLPNAHSNNKVEIMVACDALDWFAGHATEHTHDYIALVEDSRLTAKFYNLMNTPKH